MCKHYSLMNCDLVLLSVKWCTDDAWNQARGQCLQADMSSGSGNNKHQCQNWWERHTINTRTWQEGSNRKRLIWRTWSDTGASVCQLLTGNLCHHCLRDPPVPQEGFDLFFHQTAVPPANTKHTKMPLYRARAKRLKKLPVQQWQQCKGNSFIFIHLVKLWQCLAATRL